MNAAAPTLSIAMPCYNVEAYLERGLGSLADERLAGNVEVIVVNDGSTDSTQSIAERFIRQHPNIFRLVSKENGGHGSAVNAGLAAARGRYFRVIDGDDWVNAEALLAVVARLKQLDSDIVVDERTFVDMATLAPTHEPLPNFVRTGEELPFAQVCNQGSLESFINIHTLNFKTELLRTHGVQLREGIFYVDYEYIVKGTCFAKTATFLREPVYQYLVGNAAQSMAAPNMVKRYQHHEAVLRELLAFEAANPDLPAEMAAYLRRKIQLLIHTHYNILLIFDANRKRGATRGREFDAWLKAQHPAYHKLTAKRRRTAWTLHYAGIDAAKLNKLMGR